MSKSYNFGEKKTEFNIKLGKEVDVFQTPKYVEAKKKAIETLESDMYKGVLSEADFWILMNTTKSGKIAYTGLIISHNGCLKINDALPAERKFKPSCIQITENGYKSSLVYSYINDDQGIYEVGEVNAENCKNAYPYAMALKRCIDRVILKSSKLAYSGIYSDAEAEEFKKDIDESDTAPEKKAPKGNARSELVDFCNTYKIDIRSVAATFKLNNNSTDDDFNAALAYCKDIARDQGYEITD